MKGRQVEGTKRKPEERNDDDEREDTDTESTEYEEDEETDEVETKRQEKRATRDEREGSKPEEELEEEEPVKKPNCKERCLNFWTCRPNDPNAPELPFRTRCVNCLKPEQEQELAEGETPKREAWGNRFTFFISTLGMSVGLGQVWRFPTLAYKFGGGSFLIIYSVMIMFLGNTLFFFEIANGQYTSKNLLRVYDKVPFAIGLGWSMISYAFFLVIYYNNMVGFCIYYFIASFQSPLPWTVCPEEKGHYDPVKCKKFDKDLAKDMDNVDCGGVDLTFNRTRVCLLDSQDPYLQDQLSKCCVSTGLDCDKVFNTTDICRPREYPSQYYWSHTVNRLFREGDPKYRYIGEPNWWLLLSLFVAWVLNYLALYKGIKSMGFMMYIMVPLPYIVFFIMLFVAIPKQGAAEGVRRFFTPDFASFINIDAWRVATEQAFYSLGVAMGSLITFGSYNQFNSPCHVDSTYICVCIVLTSILCSCVVFSILGFLSATTGKPFNEVVTVGPGLVFIVYAESFNFLPGSVFWAILFYFMLINLGSKCVSANLQSVAAVIYELWPRFRHIKYIINAFLTTICFFVGTPITFRGGLAIYDAFDIYPAGLTLIPICSLELIIVIYVYGLGRFGEDIAYMLGGWYPNRYYRYQWMLGPFILLGVFFYGVTKMTAVNWAVWTHVLAWFLFLCVIGPFFLMIVYQYYVYSKKLDLEGLVRPVPGHGPADPMNAKFRHKFVSSREIF